jgi:hypothetical protein
MRFLASIRIIRVALALAVALWMAGAGCLLGCENMVAAAAVNESAAATTSVTVTNSSTLVAAGDACPSMRSHDCCARHGRKAEAQSTSKPASQPIVEPKTAAQTSVIVAAEFGATSSMMMDCPLAVNASAALSKAKPDTSLTALAHTGAGARLPLLQEQTTDLSPPPLLPNRGHTYLRCCVFLI